VSQGYLNDYVPNRTSILCPTRDRPKGLVRMMTSALDNASSPDSIEFCLYIDSDDHSYELEQLRRITSNLHITRGPRLCLSLMFNYLMINSKGEYLLWTGDDTKFLSKNWDEKLKLPISKVPDKLVVSYANDLANYAQNYATNGMIHRNWIELFGFLFSPHMRDNGVDFWISYVARNARRLSYCEDVLIEHLQYRQNKSLDDQTYSARRKDHLTYSLPELYHANRGERQRDAVILQIATNQLPKPKFGFFLGTLAARLLNWKDPKYSDDGRFIYMCSIPDIYFVAKLIRKLPLLSLKMH